MNYLITGGTGTLGQILTTRLLSEGHCVTVYSRDEFKQAKMQKHDNLRLVVGDIRDRDRTIEVFEGIDRVIHAAALKHIPVGEEEAGEVVLTNVIGTKNVLAACLKNGVRRAVITSTDKACHPVNLYGATKLAGEKLFIGGNLQDKTVFTCVRYGNVVGSRGSVVEYILQKKPESINATHPEMTRFWIDLDEAIRLIMLAFETDKGNIVVPKAKSSSVIKMFKWLKKDIKINYTGVRPGEKIHEVMINKDESMHTKEYDDHFIIEPELFGAEYTDRAFEYTSKNCMRLTKDEFLELL